MRILYVICAVLLSLNLIDLLLGNQVEDRIVVVSLLCNILMFVSLTIKPNKEVD